MRRFLVLWAAFAVVAFPATARAEVVWLCHPDLAAAEDPCKTPLDTTRVAPDGSRSQFTPKRPALSRRPVDCFYVYPTVSNQPGPNATQAKDPEIRAVAKFQVSRYQPRCRMFAPVYRQATVPGIAGNSVPAVAEVAFSDVREAWLRYLERDNGGRGVVLLGHSQGTLMLRQLIRTEIDPEPALRRRLVGAAILGGNVTTRAGETRGGDFQRVGLCTRRSQFGCVVAYSTYQEDPGPVSFFGNTNSDPIASGFGFPNGEGFEIACTDPGRLAGSRAPVGLAVPTEPFPPGFIALGIAAVSNGPIPEADTTWVEGFEYTGACRTIGEANVYRFEPVGDSRRLAEQPPGFGTHLVDFNLGTDRLVRIARLQTRAYVGARLRVRRRGRRLVADLPAPGVLRAGSQRVRVGRPSRVRMKVRSGRVKVRFRTGDLRFRRRA